MDKAHDVARQHLQQAAKRRKDRYDSKASLYHLKVGDLVFISGQGCRDPETNIYAGTIIKDDQVTSYNIIEQTKGVLQNVERALNSVGLNRQHLADVNIFLTDMKDFEGMNQVWNDFFNECKSPTRTTVSVNQLPGHNKIEMKAIASLTEAE